MFYVDWSTDAVPTVDTFAVFVVVFVLAVTAHSLQELRESEIVFLLLDTDVQELRCKISAMTLIL